MVMMADAEFLLFFSDEMPLEQQMWQQYKMTSADVKDARCWRRRRMMPISASERERAKCLESGQIRLFKFLLESLLGLVIRMRISAYITERIAHRIENMFESCMGTKVLKFRDSFKD